MVDLNKFSNAIKRRPSPKYRSLFHFTERANLPHIRKYGLLSLREIVNKGLVDVQYCSSENSRRTDRTKGLDDYVHLCLYPDHPMQFAKSYSGDLKDCAWLKVSPDIILEKGVLFCSIMSNSNDAEVIPISDITLKEFDADIVLKFQDWSDTEIRNRLDITKKYEILVPKRIPLELIGFE